jgi:hypothetical protein
MTPKLLQLPLIGGNDEESEEHAHRNHGRGPRKIGLAGESLVEFFLWQYCDHVVRAAEGSPYDVLAEYEGRILKIQVKTSRYCLHGHTQKAFRYDFVRKSNVTTLLRIPVIPATDSGGSRPPDPEEVGRLPERSDAGVYGFRMMAGIKSTGRSFSAWTLPSF